MTPAARSVQAFAVYLILLAVLLLLAPNLLLQAMGLPPTSEVWVRVVGMLVAFLSVYYWIAAATNLIPILRATVLCRLTVPVFFLVFVLAGWALWPLLLFGILDAAAALWTLAALRGSAARA